MLNEEQYRDEVRIRTDIHGLVNPKPVLPISVDETGNGLLYTSMHIIILVLNKWIKKQDAVEFYELYKKCETESYSSILNRSPTKKDQNGWDDYIGVCAAFFFLGNSSIPSRILADGKKRLFFFTNGKESKDKWKSFFGRNPRFIAHMYYCTYQYPPFLIRIIAYIQTYLSAVYSKPTDYDDWNLGYLMAVPMMARSGLSNKIAKYFVKQMIKKVPEYQSIFGTVVEDIEHPFKKVRCV